MSQIKSDPLFDSFRLSRKVGVISPLVLQRPSGTIFNCFKTSLLRRHFQKDALTVARKEPLNGHIPTKELLFSGRRHVGRPRLTVQTSKISKAGSLHLT